ncbi:uncharacterized protein TNCV_3136261 [Trichonephila clavipes]|nr:uncharacterized protein TNCV_3136261 [Trichonephila clavipes]
MSTARVIFDHVPAVRPDVHRHILHIIQPHSLEAILELFQHHLEQSVPDLRRLNQHQERLPDLCLKTSAKHWLSLLRRLDAERVTAFSDIRAVFQKCGIVAYFFNWIRVVQEQLPLQNSVHMKNIMTILKYQCRTGRPLPLTRYGLAKNPERSPLEILSFEAWKRNCSHVYRSTIGASDPFDGKNIFCSTISGRNGIRLLLDE